MAFHRGRGVMYASARASLHACVYIRYMRQLPRGRARPQKGAAGTLWWNFAELVKARKSSVILSTLVIYTWHVSGSRVSPSFVLASWCREAEESRSLYPTLALDNTIVRFRVPQYSPRDAAQVVAAIRTAVEALLSGSVRLGCGGFSECRYGEVSFCQDGR